MLDPGASRALCLTEFDVAAVALVRAVVTAESAGAEILSVQQRAGVEAACLLASGYVGPVPVGAESTLIDLCDLVPDIALHQTTTVVGDVLASRRDFTERDDRRVDAKIGHALRVGPLSVLAESIRLGSVAASAGKVARRAMGPVSAVGTVGAMLGGLGSALAQVRHTALVQVGPRVTVADSIACLDVSDLAVKRASITKPKPALARPGTELDEGRRWITAAVGLADREDLRGGVTDPLAAIACGITGLSEAGLADKGADGTVILVAAGHHLIITIGRVLWRVSALGW